LEEKHACADLIGVSLVGLGTKAFMVGHATLKVASSKVVKYEKTCSDNQHAFIPFTFDIFGFLAPDVVNLQHRVQMDMHRNIMSPRSMDFVFMMIDFAIQRLSGIAYSPFVFHAYVIFIYNYWIKKKIFN
jgi:hypothetical protein